MRWDEKVITKVDHILTDIERAKFKSMARYWREVEEREDTSPLEQEFLIVARWLQTRMLFVLARYIEITKGVNE